MEQTLTLTYMMPERRTERCSPSFWPGDRFCEPSFRYLSPGSEGEKYPHLGHTWKNFSFTQLDSQVITILKYMEEDPRYLLHVIRIITLNLDKA